MKRFFSRCFLLPAIAAAPAALAQTVPSPEPPSRGTVVFSRSAADAKPPEQSAPPALLASVMDAMRTAPTFTSYDFTVHLQPATASLQVQLRATIRNDGSTPLSTLPLQLSSTLHFERIRLADRALRFAVHTVGSDADHTGALIEAAIALPTPLAPGAQTTLTIDYSGTIAPSSTRLDRIGTPGAIAAQSDWDRIGEGFTGLRGFGNTVWYPVASVPALLGDGARLFREIDRQKARNSGASVRMDLTEEFTGDAPNIAVLDGQQVVTGTPASLPSATFPGILRLSLPPTPLGFTVPSLVLATRVAPVGNSLVSVAALPAHAEAAAAYTAAADLLEPLFADWFGPQPPAPLLLVDLPVEGAQPAEDSDALLLSATGGSPSQLAGALAAPLTHAYFHSPRPWLNEGVPNLLRVLWTDRTEGRDKALEELGASHGALALAEPATPGASAGEPLTPAAGSAPATIDPIFYRTKATYVLWTLRALAGDTALSAALRSYDPARDTTPSYFEDLLQKATTAGGNARSAAPNATVAPASTSTPGTTETAPGADTASTPDLHSFFQSWIYSDRGLPDLSIANVFPSRTGAGDQWLVAVQVANAGYTDADVPLTVRSAGTTVTELVRVPARGNLSRRILLLGEPTEVDVNDGSVPEVSAGIHQRLLKQAARQ